MKRHFLECVEKIVGKRAVIDCFQTTIEKLEIKGDDEICHPCRVKRRKPKRKRDEEPRQYWNAQIKYPSQKRMTLAFPMF